MPKGIYTRPNYHDIKCLNCKKIFHPLQYRTKYCSRSCYFKSRIGQNHPNFKGGWKQLGYWFISKDGKNIGKHKHLMEQKIGRKLHKNEIVHHINGNKLDNRLDNLQIMTRKEHMDHHRKDLLRAKLNFKPF